MERIAKLHLKDALEILACIVENAVILDQVLIAHVPKISLVLDVNMNLMLVRTMSAKMEPHVSITVLHTHAIAQLVILERIVKKILSIAKTTRVLQAQLASILIKDISVNAALT
jgi:hypothetical protein